MSEFLLAPVDHRPDSVGVIAPSRIAGQDSTATSIPPPEKPHFDWSAYYGPSDALRAATHTPKQWIGYLAADALIGMGVKPYMADDLASRIGNVLGLTPLGVVGSALDLIDAKHRAGLPGAMAAAGMIPRAKRLVH